MRFDGMLQPFPVAGPNGFDPGALGSRKLVVDYRKEENRST
jgi:hypothetical protein